MAVAVLSFYQTVVPDDQKDAVADPRDDFICEILPHGISHRAVHPLNQQRQKDCFYSCANI